MAAVEAHAEEHDMPRELTELELKAAAQQILQELEARGAPIYIPRQDREYMIVVGPRMLTLRRAVIEANGLFSAAPEEKALLEYYANSIAYYFS